MAKKFYNVHPRTKRIRIFASEADRANRGFIFESGIDDAETECGLDGSKTDFVLENYDKSEPEVVLQPIIELLKSLEL